MNEHFCRRPDVSLRWIQAAALYEAAQNNGLFAIIGLGNGKTLITLLLPTALDSKKAVLLVPSQLHKKTFREIKDFYAERFRLPDTLAIHSYEELSSADGGDLLDKSGADLVVLDEAHALKRRESARTKRFMRFFQENPDCRLAAVSATMANRKIVEYGHLIELALGRGSPVPKGYREIVDWGGALDVDPQEPKSPGALRIFCGPGENVRQGFQRRLRETPGVVVAQAEDYEGSLIFRKRTPKIPSDVEQARQQVMQKWEIGDVIIVEATHFGRIMKQLSCGFYYRANWGPKGPDHEWLDARKEWHKELRHFLRYRARAGVDSPLLVERAIEAGKIKGSIRDAWDGWAAVKDRPEPTPEPVWISDFVVKDAVKWAKKKQGIIWYSHKALEEKLAEHFPVYGSGEDASEATAPVIACSVAAQGTGKNLQRYANNLLLAIPPNGLIVEQLVGRTHRSGQEADEVCVDWNGHTPELISAYEQAMIDAQAMQDREGQKQKILLARHL